MSDIKASHVIPASAETIHWGFFDSALPPVCTIKSGETVTINSISGGPDQLPTSASFDILPEHRGIIATLKPKLGLHILTGPVAVEGAEPGDMLEVRIEKIELRQNWGLISTSRCSVPCPRIFRWAALSIFRSIANA
jgi:acetamidase/formamidase